MGKTSSETGGAEREKLNSGCVSPRRSLREAVIVHKAATMQYLETISSLFQKAASGEEVDALTQKIKDEFLGADLPSSKAVSPARALIKSRLADLGLKLVALSVDSGVPTRTIYRAMAGESINSASIAAIETVLELQLGDLAKLLPEPASSERRSEIGRKAGRASGKCRRSSLAATIQGATL